MFTALILQQLGLYLHVWLKVRDLMFQNYENSRAGKKQPNLIHYSEAFLSDFYERWVADPEAFNDNEFFRVHMHLLACEDCSSLAKKCEDRAAATPVGAQSEMKARRVGGA
jgi:hypothetical protein